ncbi:MAG: hypothetical protein SOH80_02275 [Eubacteriales bacterium]|jgi:hypothetical protein
MKRFMLKMVSVLTMVMMLLGMSTPVYAKDLVGHGTGTITAVTASAGNSSSTGSTVSSAAKTTGTGTSQRTATTSTTAVSTGVVDESVPFVLIIAGAAVMIICLIHGSMNQKRYGNYGEYWLQYMIEYEKKLK